METKARYVLVGFCTLLAIAISLGLLMFSLHSGDRQKTAYYATVFTGSVAGLSQGNDVRFNGIKVGEVRSFTIDPDDPSRVRVVMAVNLDTPIREDSEASLAIQGLTGLAVIDITGGSASSLKIPPGTPDDMLEIRSKRSALSSVVAEAPTLINQANELLSRGSNVLSPENQDHLTRILKSLSTVSETLARQNGNIESTLENMSKASVSLDNILSKTDRLVTNDLSKGAAQFNTTMQSLKSILAQAEPGAKRLSGGTDELLRLLSEAQMTLRNLNSLLDNINNNPQRFFFGDNVPDYSVK